MIPMEYTGGGKVGHKRKIFLNYIFWSLNTIEVIKKF